MKSMKTLALVAGLLGLSGVSQAQFSSTLTAVSDYDFRGVSQSAKDPAFQASADYAFGDSGFSVGAWASNVDFGDDVDGDIELDLYANYVGEINDTFSWTAGLTYYMYPGSDDIGEYPEIYVGFNAGNFSFKQWYADSLFDSDESGMYTEANYTHSFNDAWSLAFHAGYTWGDLYDILEDLTGDSFEVVDYAVQLNWSVNNFTIFGKFTGTDASGFAESTGDVNNNEPRFLVGVTTTLPWGVAFPEGLPPTIVPVHPTQLYEAAALVPDELIAEVRERHRVQRLEVVPVAALVRHRHRDRVRRLPRRQPLRGRDVLPVRAGRRGAAFLLSPAGRGSQGARPAGRPPPPPTPSADSAHRRGRTCASSRHPYRLDPLVGGAGYGVDPGAEGIAHQDDALARVELGALLSKVDAHPHVADDLP